MSAPVESKHDKFLRLSDKRAERAVHHVLLLRNLASADYENTPEEAEALVARLQEPVDEIAEAFAVDTSDPVDEAMPEEEGAETPPAAEPAPEPAAAAPSGKAEKEPEFPTKAESMELMRVGPQIGKAIEALMDEDPDQAMSILTDLMRS